jgi:hypothetical protein
MIAKEEQMSVVFFLTDEPRPVVPYHSLRAGSPSIYLNGSYHKEPSPKIFFGSLWIIGYPVIF